MIIFSISSDIKKDKEVNEAIMYANYFYSYFKRVIYNEDYYIKILIYINLNHFIYPQPLTGL
jgi:hypothetical protein